MARFVWLLVGEEALGFLRDAKNRPFALYVHYADPHEHHRLPPPRHRGRFVDPEILKTMAGREKAPYRDMSRRVDESIEGFPVRGVEAPTLDEATRRSLQALGYLSDDPADTMLRPASDRSSGG